MKRPNIIIIGILASIALILLLSMQLIWINNAAKIKDKNFEHNVTSAVENVVLKLDKLQSAKSFNKAFKAFPDDSAFFSSFDSVSRFLSHYYRFSPDPNRSNIPLDSVFNKYFFIKNIFINLLNYYNYTPIEKRISANELDSLIKQELKNKDINIKYEFGIFSPHKNQLVLQKTGKYSEKLISKSIKINLSANQIYAYPEFLYIYFPHRTSYIFSHIWGLLLISAVLIAVLVFIFSFTISTIVKQKKLAELRNDLINNITHEFKTPISTISLACEALNDRDLQKSSAEFNNYINIIKEENERLEVMTENVLQAALISRGHLQIFREAINIHELISGVITNISIQVEKKNGVIVKDFNADKEIINADRLHLGNVIYNLIDNANKYSGNNSIITVRTENIEEGVIISVADNGIGISKLNQKKIFDTLFRVPTGNIHDAKGFGLGLGYAKAIIEKHGGSISVESEIKKGSTFRIMLPFY